MARFDDSDDAYKDRVLGGPAHRDRTTAAVVARLSKGTFWIEHIDPEERGAVVRDGFNVWACACRAVACTGWQKGGKGTT